MPDYIPGGDAEFNAWLGNFVTYANANLAGLGLVAADMTPVTSAQGKWNGDYPAHIAAQANAQSLRAVKDASRAAVEAAVRPLVRRLQASPTVSDGERASLEITVPDPTGTPVAPPTTHPLVVVECGARLRHTIHFADSATPTRRAKPAGVLGAEIWVKILPVGQPPPTDPAALSFMALDTKTPYTLDFDGADGGKNAHYMLRWVSTTGQKGPWGDTAMATIGA